MKILFFLFILMPVFASQDIPKKTNCIVIESDSVDFVKVARILMDAGYPIEKSDKEIGYIQTDYKAIKMSQIKLNVTIQGNKVTIRGKMKTDLGEDDVQNIGMKGSPMKVAFDEMNNLATSIPGTIVYLIK